MARYTSRSAFVQIADDLRQRIMGGEFTPGGKLPPKRVLAAEYEVSGATMDKALEVLKDERIVEGRTGDGTYVLERQRHLWSSSSVPYLTPRPRGASDAWSDQTAAKGRAGSQKLVEVAEIEPPGSVCEVFGLQATDLVVVRRRIVYLDDLPIELADSYYPTSIARGTPLALRRKIKGGSVTALSDLGFRAARVAEDVSARRPTAEECASLAVDEGLPLLVLHRVVRDGSGNPFEVSVMTMPSDRRRLQYSIELG